MREVVLALRPRSVSSVWRSLIVARALERADSHLTVSIAAGAQARELLFALGESRRFFDLGGDRRELRSRAVITWDWYEPGVSRAVILERWPLDDRRSARRLLRESWPLFFVGFWPLVVVPEDRVRLSSRVKRCAPFSAAVAKEVVKPAERREVVVLDRVVGADDATVALSTEGTDASLIDLLQHARGAALPPDPFLVLAARTMEVPTVVVARSAEEERLATWMEVTFGVDRESFETASRNDLVAALRSGTRGLLREPASDISREAQKAGVDALAFGLLQRGVIP